MVHVPPDIVEMFQTLPGFSSEYEAVPYLKKHVLSSAALPHDVEMSVAILYVMYGISKGLVPYCMTFCIASNTTYPIENTWYSNRAYSAC